MKNLSLKNLHKQYDQFKMMSNPQHSVPLIDQKKVSSTLTKLTQKCVSIEDIELCSIFLKICPSYKNYKTIINFKTKGLQNQFILFCEQNNKIDVEKLRQIECADEISNKEYFNYHQQELFFKKAEEICFILGPKQEEQVIAIIKSLTKYQDLYLYQKKFQSSEKFEKFLKSIKFLPHFEKFKQYLGINIEKETAAFASYFTKQLFKQIPSSKQHILSQFHILDKLIHDPLYNFMMEQNLNRKEKQILFQILWKDSYIYDYALKSKIPQSLKKHIDDSIAKLMHFLSQQKIKKPSENKSIISSMMTFDEQKFFSINSIHSDKKIVYDFLQENIPNYFLTKQRNQQLQCKAKLQIDIKLKLRRKLHELEIFHQLYADIEKYVINNNLIQILGLKNLDYQTKKHIINYVDENRQIRKYWKIQQKDLNYVEEVRNSLIKILVNNCSFSKYSNIVNFTDYFIEYAMYPEGYFNPKLYNQLTNICSKNKILADYQKNEKVNFKASKNMVRKEFIFIFCQIQGFIPIDIMCQLIEQYLNFNSIAVFTQSSHLSQKQKQQFEKIISVNKYIKQFNEAFEVMERIQSIKGVQSLMKNPNDGETLGQYYKQYGQITVENQEIKFFDFEYLKSLEKIFNYDFNEVKKIQSSQKYINFRKQFPQIFKRMKDKTKFILVSKIKKYAEEENIRNVEMFLHEADAIDYDFQSKDAQYLQTVLIDLVKDKKFYKDYLKIKKIQNINRRLVCKVELINFISSLRNRDYLRLYKAGEKQLIFSRLEFNVDDIVTQLAELEMTPIDKQTLLTEIENSYQYQAYLSKKQSQQKPILDIIISDFVNFLKNSNQVFGEITREQGYQILNEQSLQCTKKIFNILNFTLTKQYEREVIKYVFKQSKNTIKEFMEKFKQAVYNKQVKKDIKLKTQQKQQNIRLRTQRKQKKQEKLRNKHDIIKDVLNILASGNQQLKQVFDEKQIQDILKIGIHQNLKETIKILKVGLKKKNIVQKIIQENHANFKQLTEEYRKINPK